MTASIHSCWIVADDLSGAADCAAAFARVTGPVPVLLGASQKPLALTSGPACVAIDSDSRAMDPAAAVAAVTCALELLARGDLSCDLVYKKIDSTLRGHLALELDAALRALPQLAGAIVAPAFPAQGRTLAGGRLQVHGRPAGHLGHSGDLLALLDTPALRPVLLDGPMDDPAGIVQRIASALANGAHTLVADARQQDDLARIADALCSPGAPRLLVAGSAGLARALAEHVEQRCAASAGDRAMTGPVLAIVGSFSQACAVQVQELEDSGEAQVIRFSAAQWLDAQQAAARRTAIAAARQSLRDGGNVLFAIGGEVVQPFSRLLVEALARATAPLLQHAGAVLLTGGDTARAMFNELGIARLDVCGEFEPGIAIGRTRSPGAPAFVLKAGGFGDRLALRRIIRHCGQQHSETATRQVAPS